jgi:hypothetical protein
MKLPRLLIPLFSASLCTAPAFAETPATADPPRLADIHAVMEAEIAAHHAAGVVTLVLKDGKVVHHDAAGMADR